MRKTNIFAALMLAGMTSLGASAQHQFAVQANKPGIEIQPTMYGIFFEDINFGADGGLYASWDKDNEAAAKICKETGLLCYDASHFVLEGGSIHSDGEGTVIVTETCLLSKGRNPKLTKG